MSNSGEIRRAVGVVLLALGLLFIVICISWIWFYMADSMSTWRQQHSPHEEVSNWAAFWSSLGWKGVLCLLLAALPGGTFIVFGFGLFMDGRNQARIEA